MLLRKEQRAMELDEFKNKAKKVMQTFNVKPTALPSSASAGSVFGERSIMITMTNFGIVFPLSQERANYSIRDFREQNSASKAFLICIDRLQFETQKGKRGRFDMKSFCFQFVSRYARVLLSISWD